MQALSSVHQQFQTTSLKLQGRLKPNFLAPEVWAKQKLFKRSRSHDQHSLHAKTVKSLLLHNQMNCDLETWYATPGTQVLPRLYKL